MQVEHNLAQGHSCYVTIVYHEQNDNYYKGYIHPYSYNDDKEMFYMFAYSFIIYLNEL